MLRQKSHNAAWPNAIATHKDRLNFAIFISILKIKRFGKFCSKRENITNFYRLFLD